MPDNYIGETRLNSPVGSSNGVLNLDVANGGVKVDGTVLTVTAAQLNDLSDGTSFDQSTIAVAAEAANAIAVTVTLKTGAGVAVDEARAVTCWLSSSATTGAVAADDGDWAVTATTGSIIKIHTTDLMFEAITNTSGVLVLSCAGTGDLTAKYLWVKFPNGKCKVSAVIDLA